MSNIIRKIKDIFPVELKNRIKTPLVKISDAITFYAYSNCHILRIKKKLNSKERVNVVFLCQFPEMWNSTKSVFLELNKSELFRAEVLAVPKKKVMGLKEIFSEDNDALEYFKKESVAAVDARKKDGFIDIREFKPDYIFIQRPYDGCMPAQYRMKTLAKYGLICYIPYYSCLTEREIHLKVQFEDSFLKQFNLFFADCQRSYDFVYRRLQEMHIRLGKNKQIFNIGFPRYELLNDRLTVHGEKKTFLWLPRWTMDSEKDRSHFFDYIKPLLDYFNNNKQLELIIRPHPSMFTNFRHEGYITEDEINVLLKYINEQPNVRFDSNEDYLITFNESDFLIADPTSLICEYFITNKPIIFCGEKYTGSIEGEQIARTYYCVENQDELILAIGNLASGKDEKKEQRSEIIRQMKLADTNVACRIMDVLSMNQRGK